MAISAPAKSAQYTKWTANPSLPPGAFDWGAKFRVSRSKLTFTAAGFTTAALGDIKLIRMPAGKITILSDLSWIICPAGTSTADLDIGTGAYTAADGTTTALSGIALADSLDVGGGALDQALPLPTNGELVIESQSGFDIVCSFDTANSPALGDLIIRVAFMQAN